MKKMKKVLVVSSFALATGLLSSIIPAGISHAASHDVAPQLNVQPIVAPLSGNVVAPNVEPDVQPIVAPNVQPEVAPNVQPNVEPNVEPEVEPNVEPEVAPSDVVHPDVN